MYLIEYDLSRTRQHDLLRRAVAHRVIREATIAGRSRLAGEQPPPARSLTPARSEGMRQTTRQSTPHAHA